VKPSPQACLVKIMIMYVVHRTTNMMMGACKTLSIRRTLVVHKDPMFHVIVCKNKGFCACKRYAFYIYVLLTLDVGPHQHEIIFLIQIIQECIWKEECWHLVKTSTIWLDDWSWKKCATSIWTHLQLVTRRTHDALTIHQWKSWEKVFSTF
jgi:hypothetical protein